MATITRGATVLTPTLILGWSLNRPSQTVVHDIIGSADTEQTVRAPGLARGDVRTFWPTYASALAALSALSVPGGPWVWTQPGLLVLTAAVTGDVRLESATDEGSRWIVTVGVTQVSA